MIYIKTAVQKCCTDISVWMVRRLLPDGRARLISALRRHPR